MVFSRFFRPRLSSPMRGNDSVERFNHILMIANRIYETNKAGLPDLVRALMRPLESELILAVVERGQDAAQAVSIFDFFFDGLDNHLFLHGEFRGIEMPADQFPLELGSDVILPCPWDVERYIASISWIGGDKTASHSPSRLRESRWRQDLNHSICLWLPWRIAFVSGGNHSIAAGILASDGVVVPDRVYDMGFLLDDISCDGNVFLEQVSGLPIAPIKDVRRAAVFEIGRLLRPPATQD